MPRCKLCNKSLGLITETHLKSAHEWSIKDYIAKFGSPGCHPTPPSLLSKNNPRYVKWRKSLRKRPKPWNAGLNKDTSQSCLKISKTFRKKRIDNFAGWRLEMKRLGKIRSFYPEFEKTPELAFLVGLALGDGHIGVFPRTEAITIALNSKYPKLISYTRLLLKKFFEKEPSIIKSGNCVKLRIYQKKISERLQVPSGCRRHSRVGIPEWSWGDKELLVACLKGLFEAEGSLCIHLPTYTYNFAFSNKNYKLLKDVGRALRTLGFHPEYWKNATRLRKKHEVEEFKKLIAFREFDIAG